MIENKKQLEELTFLEDIKYHKEHTWAKMEGDLVKIGISDFAQDQLGDVIFIDLPEVGDEFSAGEKFGEAESAKTVSSLYMPVSGEIIAVNEELEDSPENLNTDPYETGWIIKVKINNKNELEELLSKDEYIEFLQEA